MKGMMGGMAGLMKQANQMQLTGDNKVVGITINPEVLKSGDVEMLQDLVASAVNDALKVAKETSTQEMSKITGGLSIPGF